MLFPSRGKLGEARAKEQEGGKGEFQDTSDDSKKIWWIKQTVGNFSSESLCFLMGPVRSATHAAA